MTIVIGAAVIVVLLGWLTSSFLRHLRWEERLFRWRMRIFFHCVAFFAIVAIAAFGYLHFHHSSSSTASTTIPSSSTSTTSSTLSATTTNSAVTAPAGLQLHVHAITISLTHPGLWIISGLGKGQSYTATDAVHRTLSLGGSYRCRTRGDTLISCARN